MAEPPTELANADPFEIVQRPEDPQSDPLRLELTIHPALDKTNSSVDLPHARWAVDASDEHVNPKWDEWFEVVSGEYRVESDSINTTLSAGDDIVLPANTPHSHWNPSDRPTRIRYEARPGLNGAEAFETLFALAQAGEVRENGFPNPLQFAVIQDASPGMFFSTDLPRSVQRAMFTVLAPIGRGLGYKSQHSRDEIADLR